MFLYNLAMLLNEKKIICQICEKKFFTFQGYFKTFSQSSNLIIHFERYYNQKIIDKSDKILNIIENDKYSGSF